MKLNKLYSTKLQATESKMNILIITDRQTATLITQMDNMQYLFEIGTGSECLSLN